MNQESKMKPIRLTAHANGYCEARGFTYSEVEEAIRTQEWTPSRLNKLECRMEMPYKKEWNGNYYEVKQVRPIFVEEDTEIVVVTVYTYYY